MVTKPLLKFHDRGDYFEVQQNDCKCNLSNSWDSVQGGFHYHHAKPAQGRPRIGSLGVFLFLLALISSLYLVWNWYAIQAINGINESRIFDKQLKLVSLFNRHGDRAPSDEPPDVDKHKHAIEFFWPNGLHNLTDLGRMRSYKLGLALRHMYDSYIGYDHHKVLAFSSTKLRCIESLQNILRGFYELEGPRSRGLSIVAEWRHNNCTDCLPEGSGSPEEWKLIQFDTESLRTLTERDMEQCRYRKEHPSPLDTNLRVHSEIMALPGVDRLEEILVQRYGLQGFQGGAATAIYSTISSELNLVRTRESIQYADHFSDWLNEVVATTTEGGFNITLYDIFQQVTVYKYRDQTLGVSKWLEIGPIMTSLVDAQLVALGHQATGSSNESGNSNSLGMAKEDLYRDKRIIFYSSHDSILQRILQHLKLINFDEQLTYEQRFANWKMRGGDEFDKFMSGLSMSAYGMSIKFELWEAKTDGGPLSFIQLSLYNQEEARFGPIDYKALRLGEACVRLFESKYSQLPSWAQELDQFYNFGLAIDWSFGCPFELFKNVTADLMVEADKFNELC